MVFLPRKKYTILRLGKGVSNIALLDPPSSPELAYCNPRKGGPDGIVLKNNLSNKLRTNKTFRILVLIYGLVFTNIGAILIYEKLSNPPVAFDQPLKVGIACLLMGLLALGAVYRSKKSP